MKSPFSGPGNVVDLNVNITCQVCIYTLFFEKLWRRIWLPASCLSRLGFPTVQQRLTYSCRKAAPVGLLEVGVGEVFCHKVCPTFDTRDVIQLNIPYTLGSGGLLLVFWSSYLCMRIT